MGRVVLDPGPSRPQLHLYAQCERDHPGGVVLLAINTSRTEPDAIELRMPADRYTLRARALEASRVALNGTGLAVAADGVLPVIKGQPVPAGPIGLAPASITFLVVADTRNGYCR